MVRKFNDKQGNRDRECHVCVIFEGKAFSRQEAEEAKLAVFQEANFSKNGKWSNSDWTVTTNTATLVVLMRPFEGWGDSWEDVIDHVLSIFGNAEAGVTREEAEIAVRAKCPNTTQKLDRKISALADLK